MKSTFSIAVALLVTGAAFAQHVEERDSESFKSNQKAGKDNI